MANEKLKKGDRVRQVKMYHPGQECYLGRCGTVVDVRYNPNMAVYGKGEEIIVKFDEYDCKWIEYSCVLEKI